jgi:HD-like signal output (HDOD) protein
MLHDLGKLLLLQVDQGEYEELLRSVPVGADTASQQELARFGYDHAILAEHVMRQWRLPDHLCEVIRLHHDFDAASRVSPTVAESVAVLRFADHLSYVLPGDPHGDPEQIAILAEMPEAKALDLDARRLAQLWPSLFEALG